MRRYLVTTGLVVLGLLSGIALAACGGDSAPETPIVVSDTTQNLSKEEFISQADAICEEANTQIADIAAAGEGITKAAEVAQIRQQMATDIRDLGTPVDTGTSPSTSTTSTDTSSSLGDTSTAPTRDTSTFPEDSGGTGTDTGATATGTDTGVSTTDTGTTGTDTGTTSASTGDPLQDFLTALDAEVKAGEKIDLANQRGETTAEGEADLAEAKDTASTAASEYGFEQCGTDGTASSGTTTSSSSSSGTVTPAPAAPSTSAPSTSGGSSGSGTSGSGTSGGGVSSGGGVAPG